VTTIAVIGPGAIGGTLAAWLSVVKSNDVIVCARTPFDRLLVDAPGGRTLESSPRVLTDPNAGNINPVDWVLTVTKTYDVEGAARWLRRLASDRTRVAVIQNGVEHQSRFADLVPADRLLPVIIDIPAERTAPGRILQRRHGDITAPNGALGKSFSALFAGTPLTPILSDDFLSASWRKLVFNSPSVVFALTLKPAGVVRDENIAALMKAIAREALAVGRAAGATLDDAIAGEAVERYRASAPGTVNSLLADRLAKRRLEVDARNGVIVRLGKKHGIETPLNAMAVTLLEATSFQIA
jgi:2-dehydropantoate 2-reductase